MLAFGSPEYMQMGSLDDLEHLIEHELSENIQILDVFFPQSWVFGLFCLENSLEG